MFKYTIPQKPPTKPNKKDSYDLENQESLDKDTVIRNKIVSKSKPLINGGPLVADNQTLQKKIINIMACQSVQTEGLYIVEDIQNLTSDLFRLWNSTNKEHRKGKSVRTLEVNFYRQSRGRNKMSETISAEVAILHNGEPAVLDTQLDRQILTAINNIDDRTSFAEDGEIYFTLANIFVLMNGGKPRSDRSKILLKIMERIDYLKDCWIQIKLNGSASKLNGNELIEDLQLEMSEKRLLPIEEIRTYKSSYRVNGKSVEKLYKMHGKPVLFDLALAQGKVMSTPFEQMSYQTKESELHFLLRRSYYLNKKRAAHEINPENIARNLGNDVFTKYKKDREFRRQLHGKIETAMKTHAKQGLIASPPKKNVTSCGKKRGKITFEYAPVTR